MMQWNAEPLKRVGAIELGSSRKTVHAAAGFEFSEFRKSPFSSNTADDYGSFHVYYDADDYCVAVEVFSGVEVSINGEVVFPCPVDKVLLAIPSLEREGDGLVSVEESIGIYAPAGEMESILLGVQGYYE